MLDLIIVHISYATAIRDQTQRLFYKCKCKQTRHFLKIATGDRPEPQDPVMYRFTSWAQGSMLLIPPGEAENQQPLYRITVELDLNPFLPVSYITRVCRCGVEDGELVGEFGFVSFLNP